MSHILDYNKMMFKGRDGKMKIIQPKSYTDATKGDERQILDLIMEGKFVIVPVAMPLLTKEGA